MRAQECIFYQLAKTNQAGNKVWRKAMSDFSLTSVQGMVLNFLYDGDRITSRELGERAMLDSATLTGILDRLEKVGLIERLKHPSDRRAIIVCLTDDGRAVVEKTYQEIEKANEAFLRCLSVSEQKNLKTMLTKIRENAGSASQNL